MLLMGGDLPENEIRMFLARSGWSIDQIDAGVMYTKDESLKVTLNEARGITTPAPAVIDNANSIAINVPVASAPSTASLGAGAALSQSTPALGKTDPYRESADAAAADFSKDALQMSQKPAAMAMSTPALSSMNTMGAATETSNTSPMLMTMPPLPKTPAGGRILSMIIWFLFIVLIISIAAVLGFMYYTGSGVFGEVMYTKLNINV